MEYNQTINWYSARQDTSLKQSLRRLLSFQLSRSLMGSQGKYGASSPHTRIEVYPLLLRTPYRYLYG